MLHSSTTLISAANIAGGDVTVIDTLAWAVLPYAAIILMIVGLIWRYRTDQYGWTSRSSNWNESAILRWSSPMFHFGILFVALGHVMGLIIPKSVTEAVGIPQHMYHLMATIPGSIAGLVTIVGLVALLYRRIVVKSVRLATTRMDIVTYILLCLPVFLGGWATLSTQVLGGPHGYDYRETISVWFRSIFYLNPQVQLMVDVPLVFKLHIGAGLLLFCVWPFTRLIHVLSAPVGYTTRPHIVYRSRKDASQAEDPARGW